jgi:hypothetical protein
MVDLMKATGKRNKQLRNAIALQNEEWLQVIWALLTRIRLLDQDRFMQEVPERLRPAVSALLEQYREAMQ